MGSLVFGLTGGIGSGKSSVSRILAEHQVPIIDADLLARRAVVPGSAALSEIVATFGDVLTPEGSLDRAALGRQVFSDDEARARLNAIVHPRVRQLVTEEIGHLEAEGEPLICYDIPLLFETGQFETYRPVVVVEAAPEQQIARVVARDHLTLAQARARVASQIPLAQKAAQADYTVDNSGSREHCRAETERVLRAIVLGANLDLARYGLS